MGEMMQRLSRLIPVGLVYAALIGLAVLGCVLDVTSPHAHALWIVFFLMPFTIIYCIPFGMGVGILAQRLVWYTASYGMRVVIGGTLLTLVAMFIGWGGRIVANFDIIYLAAIIWPTLASGVSMFIGMYFIRAKEYEEASAYDDYDDYDDEPYGDEGYDEDDV